jgi:hypothetical protein
MDFSNISAKVQPSGCCILFTDLLFSIGNLDEKVSEKVLYEILIQAGHVVDLHIPCDKETGCRKGFAFAQYETEEIAQYAVGLFSGLVRLNGKTLKFAVCFFFCDLQYMCNTCYIIATYLVRVRAP